MKEHLNAALALHQAGSPADASRYYRQALAVEPDSGHALGFLGMATAQADLPALAAMLLRRAGILIPDEAAIHNNLGNALMSLAAPALAAGAYRRSVVLAPSFSIALCGLASTKNAEVRRTSLFLRAIACDPAYISALLNLAQQPRGAILDAVARRARKQAVSLAPSFVNALQVMAGVFLGDNVEKGSERWLVRALAIGAELDVTYFLLGTIAERLGNLDLACRRRRQALAYRPTYEPALIALGSLYLGGGKASQAAAFYSRVCLSSSQNEIAQGNRLFALTFVADIDPRIIVRENRRWGTKASIAYPSSGKSANMAAVPQRIRVGYASPEFAKHGFLAHLLPVLEHHDRDRFEIVAYCQNTAQDSWTDEVRHKVDVWRDISGKNLAEQIDEVRKDDIHVLVNLTGYLAHHRRLFAGRNAPVQVAYLNFVSSTGLSTVDARITDSWLEPEDASFLDPEEQLIRLSSGYACYRPPAYAPEPGPPPASVSGHITFGVFNNLAKISDAALSCWSDILHRVPASKLIIKGYGLSSESTRRYILNEFQKRGIAPSRLTLIGRIASDVENLLTLSQADIALDTFPFNGGMSTVETLWMGCPTVTIAGNSLVGRIGATFLSRAGFSEWITDDTEGYVSAAVSLASDRSRLADLRRRMRPALSKSVLLNVSGHTRELEGVYTSLLSKVRS